MIEYMNPKDKIIYTDCDGVCLDWEFGFHTWMEMHGHKIVRKDIYDIAKQYNLAKPVAKTLIKTFNESAAIGFLPPLRDAQYYIKKLHEKHQWKFVAITSLSLDPYAKKLRERNLAKLFGKNTFEKVICLDCGADKDEALYEASGEHNGAIWIEDKPENAEVGLQFGFDSLLIEHGHNMEYVGRAKIMLNWKDIYNYITKEK